MFCVKFKLRMTETLCKWQSNDGGRKVHSETLFFSCFPNFKKNERNFFEVENVPFYLQTNRSLFIFETSGVTQASIKKHTNLTFI